MRAARKNPETLHFQRHSSKKTLCTNERSWCTTIMKWKTLPEVGTKQQRRHLKYPCSAQVRTLAQPLVLLATWKLSRLEDSSDLGHSMAYTPRTCGRRCILCLVLPELASLSGKQPSTQTSEGSTFRSLAFHAESSLYGIPHLTSRICCGWKYSSPRASFLELPQDKQEQNKDMHLHCHLP